MKAFIVQINVILLLLAGLTTQAQNLKKVVTYYDIYKTKVHESYTTLPTAPYLMEGTYEKFDVYGAVMTKGNFKSGKKNGTFTNYFSTEMTGIYGKASLGKIWSQTNYVNDKENGLDKLYSVKNGQSVLIQQITWQMGSRVKQEAWTEGGKQIKLIQLDGKCFELYENGNKKAEYTLKAGKYEGSYTSWYPDGSMEVSSNYKNDKRQGKHIEYFKNGKAELEASYMDDKMTGLVILSYEDGSKHKMLQYDPTTYILIEEKEFSRKGILRLHRQIIQGNQIKTITYDSLTGTKILEEEGLVDGNGKQYRHGRVLQYFDNEAVAVDAEFQNGKLNGSYKQFDYEGQIINAGQTKDGNTTGEWITYYDEDWEIVELKADATYYRKINYNTPQGPWPTVDYFVSGEKQFEGMLRQVSPDVPVGMCTYYYKNGLIQQELTLDNSGGFQSQKAYSEDGKLINSATAVSTHLGPGMELTEYYPDGKIKAKGKTVDNQKIGTWTYYDEKGNSTQVFVR